MAKVTLVEARCLIDSVSEKMEWVRTQIRDVLTYQGKSLMVKTQFEQSIPSDASVPSLSSPNDSYQEKKEVMEKPRKPEKKLDQLYEELEALQLDRNKLAVAMARFESTEKFDY